MNFISKNKLKTKIQMKNPMLQMWIYKKLLKFSNALKVVLNKLLWNLKLLLHCLSLWLLAKKKKLSFRNGLFIKLKIINKNFPKKL